MREEKPKKAVLSRALKQTQQATRSCIGLEIDSASIKAVQVCLKKNGAVLVEKIAVSELKYFSFDEVPDIIRAFLKEHGFKRHQVISSFSRNLSTIRFLHLPSVNPKELQEMVDFQSVKQIPYNREDMIIGYEIISHSDEGYSNVMLAITHRNVLFQHLEAVEGAGLNTQRIDINSQGIFRTYSYLADTEIPPVAPGETVETAVVLIDIDYAHTNIQVIDGDNLLFTRAITLGINHLFLKEKKYQKDSANTNWQAELFEELFRSFAVFHREHKEYKLHKIVLCGGASNFPNIDQNISNRFNVPVELFSMTEKIESLKQFTTGLTINDKEVSILGVIGLLLPGTQQQLNLIPPQVKAARKRKRRLAKVCVAFMLLIGIGIVGAIKFYEAIDYKSRRITYLTQQVDALAPRVRRLETMRAKIDVIRDHFTGKRSSLDFLRELYVVIPEKIFLTIILYDETKYIVIKGTASNMSEVFDLIPTLENSEYFEKVSSRGVKRRKIGKKEVIDFEIQCLLIKDEDELIADASEKEIIRNPADMSTEEQPENIIQDEQVE